MRHIYALIATFLFPFAAAAQFFVTGDDPGRLKWNYMDTESYRVIYPVGSDSLARVYARKLEKYKVPISRTSGYMTGQGDGKIMPVVMHAYNDANGSVAWAPKRMDLFTVPSAYDPEPLPWSTMLSIHESRHVSQMQFGLTKKQKPGKWFIGQGWNIIAYLLYPGTTLTEGDAVAVETALSRSGRGRTADFLNYYWVAFDHGDFRDWFKWRFQSQMGYAPSYYALGYMTIGGFRYAYDYPYVMKEALNMVAEHPLKFGCAYDIMKKVSGYNRNDLWKELSDTLYTVWKTDAEKRAPYILSERVTDAPKRYTDYEKIVFAEEDMYAVKSGIAQTYTLVRISPDGKEKRIAWFPYNSSGPKWDSTSGRMYWSEAIPDARWSLKSGSKIRYTEGTNGPRKTFKNKDMLYNPDFHHDIVSAVKYMNDGRSAVEFMSSDGDILKTTPAPDSLQLVETAWINEDLYATAVSENGYGIYKVENPLGGNAEWTVTLPPQPVMIKNLHAHENRLMFACDRTGVHELYHLDPQTGEVRQKTSTRYGSSDFQYSPDNEYVYYTTQTLDGKQIFRTHTSDLIDRKVRFDSLYKYPIAEKLAEQEREAAIEQGYEDAVTVSEEEVMISEPKRYRKAVHAFNLHTWFPAYVSANNIMNMSFDKVYQAISLGVSGVSQNMLSTLIAEGGYSAHKDPYDKSKWRHSGHLKFTYSGLYPVFQFSFDINDRAALQYTNYTDIATGQIYKVDSRLLTNPYIAGKASVYVPFNFSSGGWSKGFIPKVSYSISNDIFNSGTVQMERDPLGNKEIFAGYIEGKKRIRQSISGSIRGYMVLPATSSQVYPRWGFGAEAGAFGSIDSYSIFSPMGYVYAYGYIPGVTRTQGIRLSATWQCRLREKSPFSQQVVDILPRGLSNNAALGSHLSLYNKHLVKITAEYGIPIYIGNVNIGGNVLSIKRLSLYPHFDYTFIGKQGLWSAGVNLNADLNSIITLEWPCSVGVTFSWNGGSAWKTLENQGISMKKWFVGPVFNVSF